MVVTTDPMKAKDVTGLVRWGQPGQFAQIGAWLTGAWTAERKYDGCRATLHLRDGRSSFGGTRTSSFPYWGRIAVDGLAGTILDGEFMAPPEADGRHAPHARTAGWYNSGTTRARAYEMQFGRPVFVVFDITALAGTDVTGHSYDERRAALAEVVARIQAAYPGCGIELAEQIPATADAIQAGIDAGWEGVIIKRGDSRYYPGVRSDAWVKVKATGTVDVVLTGGWKPHTRDDAAVGAVEVALVGPDGQLVPVGHVAVKPAMAATVTPRTMATLKGQVWEVAASARTHPRGGDLGKLRHPRMVRPRPGKDRDTCLADQLEALPLAV